MKYLILLLLVSVTLFFSSCGKDYTPKELEYINKIEKSRAQKDSLFKNDPTSPFNYKGKVEFHPLNYFDVDPDFVLQSKLYKYENKDTVVIFGTKGEERSSVRYGYLKLNYKDSYKLAKTF